MGGTSHYVLQEKYLTELLDNISFNCFLNFGVSYGYVDSLLAKRYVDKHFLGIDRSELTKWYNEKWFSRLKNLEFAAGDIFEFLEDKNFDEGVFFHARTLTFLSRNFIEKLYKIVAKAKFRYIVGMEPIGISRQTYKAYEFSDEDQPSVLYRGSMFIHNYPALLKNAGFSLSSIEAIKNIYHHHEDAYILRFTAHR